jgi:hypothetical protein
MGRSRSAWRVFKSGTWAKRHGCLRLHNRNWQPIFIFVSSRRCTFSERPEDFFFFSFSHLIYFQAKSEITAKDSLGVSASTIASPASAILALSLASEVSIPKLVSSSSTLRRFAEGRRRSSSADDYEGKVELLVFGPSSKQQQQRQVLIGNKALKAMCSSEKMLFRSHCEVVEYLDCSFHFSMEKGYPLAMHDNAPDSSSSSNISQSDSAPLQFYTSPSTLHFGIAAEEGSQAQPSRSSSPGTHVRMTVLKQMEMAPELEHALLYCYVANMKQHSVEMDDSSFGGEVSMLSCPTFIASDVRGIGLSDERFRVKTASLRYGEAKVPLQQPIQGDLDLSQGVLAISATHGMRHFGSGSCMLTVDSGSSVLVIPPQPRLERLDVAASVQSVEAVRMRERAQAFTIPPDHYLDFDQEGMVTCAASSVDVIKLGVNACCKDEPTQTSAFVVEFGPINPKLPWGAQFDKLQKRKLEFFDGERIKRGAAHSYGISVTQI